MALDQLTQQQALIPIMSKLMKEMKAILNKEFKNQGIDLTKEQVVVLHRLKVNDGQPQQDLALITDRDKTSLTRLLATMEKKKLVKRKKSKTDKRINLVYVTRKGLKELEKAAPVALQVFDTATQGISDRRIKSTKSLLNDIYKNLNIEHEE